MHAIEVRHLSKVFTRRGQLVQAVDDVSLVLPQGKALGFIGANGAGKSTTLKCILDFIKPTSGEITLFGLPANDYRSRRDVAFVAEKPIINDLLTPTEVLRLSLAYYKKPKPYEPVVQHWLERFDVARAAAKPLRTLSKGMQQRVALASALAVQPRLLILDEPLSGLDPIGRRDVVDILDEYTQRGGSLLFTSHVLHDVERLADYYSIIHRGRLALFKTASELLTESTYHIVLASSLGEVIEQHVDPSAVQNTLQKAFADNMRVLTVKPDLSLEKLFYTVISE